MKLAAIVMGLMAFLLAAGAGYRLATMTYETESLLPISFSVATSGERPARTPQAGGPSIGETGTGGTVVNHLRGNAWEQEGPAPKSGGGGDVDLERAGNVIDAREGDLDDAKKRISTMGPL